MEERFDLTEWMCLTTFVVEASTLRASPLMLRRKGLRPIDNRVKCSLLIEMQDGGACFGIMVKWPEGPDPVTSSLENKSTLVADSDRNDLVFKPVWYTL